MKRKLLMMIAVFIAAFISCEENEPLPVAVTDVTLNESTLELTEGDEFILLATVNPENAANKNVTWSSSDETTVTVKDGKVTAVKAGTATITVTTEDGGKTDTCKVKVQAKAYPVESVSLDKTTLELTEGDEVTLTATVTPENATNKVVIWSSSDETIVTVKDGKVTAVKAGTATITVTTEDGGKTATCSVTVSAKQEEPDEPETVSVAGVTLDKTTLELTEGDEATLIATVTPENATNKVVIWSSSDETIVTVKDGKVTAVKAGSATITVTTEDGGKTATCAVTVSAKEPEVVPVESVALDKTSLELTEGDEATLTATVTPENATDKTVTWSSSDETLATVNDGKVTALKAGTVTITVTTEDGGKTATCNVTVKAKVYPVESVSLDKTSVELTVGDEFTLTATVTPDNATNKNVTWSSSDESIVTVKDGKVTAVKAGTATIIVTTEDGGKTATCAVTVYAKQEDPEEPENPNDPEDPAEPENPVDPEDPEDPEDSEEIPVSGFDIDKTSVVLKVGEEVTIVATVTPDNATYRTVTWSSSDDTVATVVDGKVKAIKPGFATIKAELKNSWWLSCYVQVLNPGGNEEIGYDEYK